MEGLYRRTPVVKMWWDVSIKTNINFLFFFFKTICQNEKNKINWGFGWGMKSCENCSTYFITKDAKLCKSFFFPFPPFLNAHSYLFFSTFSLPIYFFCRCFACPAWSIIKPLSYLMFLSSTLYFSVKLSVCEWLWKDSWKRKGTMGREGGVSSQGQE